MRGAVAVFVRSPPRRSWPTPFDYPWTVADAGLPSLLRTTALINTWIAVVGMGVIVWRLDLPATPGFVAGCMMAGILVSAFQDR